MQIFDRAQVSGFYWTSKRNNDIFFSLLPNDLTFIIYLLLVQLCYVLLCYVADLNRACVFDLDFLCVNF